MTVTVTPVVAGTSTIVRNCGIACLAVGIIGAAAGLALALVEPAVSVERFSYPLSSGDFAVAQVLFVVQHLGLIAGLLGLTWAGVVPATRAGRIGLWGAVAGMVGLTVTEMAAVTARSTTIDSTLGVAVGAAYGVVCTVLGFSLLVLGIAMAREAAWSGWRRWVVLALGIWVFVPMFPALVLTPTDGARLAIAGWMLLFAALGLALLTPFGRPGSAQHV